MKLPEHPAEYTDVSWVQVIRNHAAEAESLKQLHPAQLALVHRQQWFGLFVPGQYQGLALSLPEALRLEESIAWMDGSVGWTVTLCAGAGWFSGFLHPDLASAVFADPEVCLAGSGKASGIARKTTTGYRVTGYWPYATGAAHATAFTANCMMEEDGVLLKEANGSPVIRAFLFLQQEVNIHHKWETIGMKATGSFSFEVNGRDVPGNRAFVINSENAYLPHPVYQYPFMAFAETTLAVNSSGMAIRFLDLCEAMLLQQNNRQASACFENAVTRLEKCRSDFYHAVTDSWAAINSRQVVTETTLKSIAEYSRKLAITARQIVDELYPYCGMSAADPDTEINRVWRNIHTASQHSLFNR